MSKTGRPCKPVCNVSTASRWTAPWVAVCVISLSYPTLLNQLSRDTLGNLFKQRTMPKGIVYLECSPVLVTIVGAVKHSPWMG